MLKHIKYLTNKTRNERAASHNPYMVTDNKYYLTEELTYSTFNNKQIFFFKFLPENTYTIFTLSR